MHVDAHADLGRGDPNWGYLVSEVLQRTPSDRATGLDEERFGCANYLAFAVACRWLKKLTYVYHQTCNKENGLGDLLHFHFKDFDPKTNTLQLKSTEDPDLLYDEENFAANVEKRIIALEPEVPFEAVHPDSFRDEGNFDFVVLCQSPEYTPETSDALIPVIERYIEAS